MRNSSEKDHGRSQFELQRRICQVVVMALGDVQQTNHSSSATLPILQQITNAAGCYLHPVSWSRRHALFCAYYSYSKHFESI